VSRTSASFSSVVTASGYFGPYSVANCVTLARLPAGLGVYDVVERGLHVGLEALRELVEYVAELWNQSRCSRVFGHAALSAWDAEALEHAAHRLKGMLMALAAPAASRAALRLEDIARERDLRLAADARAALARVLARLEPQLDALAPESVTLQSYRSTI